MSKHQEIAYLGIADLHRLYLAGELSPVDVVDACLAMIKARDKTVNAFVTVTDAEAAEAVEALLRLAGEPPV